MSLDNTITPTKRKRRGLRGAFTLVEMLVVIGVVSILAMIAYPAVNRARQDALRNGQKIKLRELGIAETTYKEAMGRNFTVNPADPSDTTKLVDEARSVGYKIKKEAVYDAAGNFKEWSGEVDSQGRWLDFDNEPYQSTEVRQRGSNVKGGQGYRNHWSKGKDKINQYGAEGSDDIFGQEVRDGPGFPGYERIPASDY